MQFYHHLARKLEIGKKLSETPEIKKKKIPKMFCILLGQLVGKRNWKLEIVVILDRSDYDSAVVGNYQRSNEVRETRSNQREEKGR